MFALILAAAVAAADPAPPPAQTPAAGAASVAPAKPAADKLVCWMEAPSGSHQKQKICATQAQVDRMKRNADDYLGQKKTETIRSPLGN